MKLDRGQPCYILQFSLYLPTVEEYEAPRRSSLSPY